MKIALINENSQASKNKMIFEILDKTAKKYKHTAINFGMFDENDPQNLTYVKAGLMAAILLNTKAVDFVVTGCGTGEGAMLALNSFPNVLCGHIVDASDAFMFRQINDGNSVAIPFAKGFGWGAELALADIFEKLLSCDGGNGYPKERVIPEQANKKILDEVKKVTHNDMLSILKNIDKNFLKETVASKSFREYLNENAEDSKIVAYINKLFKNENKY